MVNLNGSGFLTEEEGKGAQAMAGSGDGFWRRFVRRLTTDVTELDADNLSKQAEEGGARRTCDCQSGEEVTVLGRLRSVALSPRNAATTFEAELFDGTEAVTLVWLGRRRIPGIEPGRTVKVRGRLAMRDGRKVFYNPYYELQTVST